MQAKALVVATAMMALALAGCTSEPSTLTISFDQPADPVTEAFHFHASGPGDTYRWNFGDGSPSVEGPDVEHTFGFTDGVVRVSLLGLFDDGSTSESTSVDITLGSGVNSAPEYDFRANSEWLIPGESLTLSTLGTTDADGDPILTRYECRFNDQLGPPHIDNDPDSGTRGPVPIDVDAWVEFDASIPAGEPVGGDFCASYDFETDQQFSTVGAITGTLTEVGAYTFDVEIRDPKTNVPFRARAQVFVTEDRPPVNPVFTITGSLAPGFAGMADNICQIDASLCTNQYTESIKVELPFSNGTVNFDLDDAQSTATYVVRRGSTQLAAGDAGTPATLENLDKPTTLIVELEYGLGVGTDYTFTITGDYSLEPYLKYTFVS